MNDNKASVNVVLSNQKRGSEPGEGKSLHDIEQVRLKKVRMERRLELRGG